MKDFRDIDISTGQVSTAGSDSGMFDIDRLPEALVTEMHTIPRTKVRGEVFGTDLLLGYNVSETFGNLNLYKMMSVNINADILTGIKGFPYITSIWLTDGSPYNVKDFRGLDEENIYISGSVRSIEKIVPKLCADPVEVKKAVSFNINMGANDNSLRLKNHRCWIPSVEFVFKDERKDIPRLEISSPEGCVYTSQQINIDVTSYDSIGELILDGLNFKGPYHGRRGTMMVLTCSGTKETEIGCLDLCGSEFSVLMIRPHVYIKDIKGIENIKRIAVNGNYYYEIDRCVCEGPEDFRKKVLAAVEEGIVQSRKNAEDIMKDCIANLRIPANKYWSSNPDEINELVVKNLPATSLSVDFDPMVKFADISERLTSVVQDKSIDLQTGVVPEIGELPLSYTCVDGRSD